jgi:hypothetical protein
MKNKLLRYKRQLLSPHLRPVFSRLRARPGIPKPSFKARSPRKKSPALTITDIPEGPRKVQRFRGCFSHTWRASSLSSSARPGIFRGFFNHRQQTKRKETYSSSSASLLRGIATTNPSSRNRNEKNRRERAFGNPGFDLQVEKFF